MIPSSVEQLIEEAGVEKTTALVPYFCNHGIQWWCVACDVNARAMCWEECQECSDAPCLSAQDCKMVAPRPPRRPRRVVYAKEFLDNWFDIAYGAAFRALDSDDS